MLVGLFPQSGTDTPRQAAQVVRAMYVLTGDTGTDKLTFTPGSLEYTITGLPGPVSPSTFAGGQDLLFQNSTGTFFLYVWNAQVSPGGSSSSLTVTFGSSVSSATLYRISDSSSPSAPTTALQTVSGTSITWDMDANVYLVVISSPNPSSTPSASVGVALSTHLTTLKSAASLLAQVVSHLSFPNMAAEGV